MPDTPSFVSSGDPVDVAVVVITFRSAAMVDQLFASLHRAVGGLRVSVVVVDNASDDGTPEVVAAHDDVVLVRSEGNTGYAHGVNAGIAASPHAGMVLVLNPDLRAGPTLLTDLVEAVRSRSDLGIVVPVLQDDRGRAPSLRREPTVLRAFGDALLGARWTARPGRLGEIVYDPLHYERPGPVDWATGAALGISAGCLEDVGRWDDELFFLYSEETDYCRRARAAGWRVEVVPSAVAHHTGGGSGSSPVLDGVLGLSRVRYMHKHHGAVRARATWVALLLGHLLRIRRPGGRERLRILARPEAHDDVVRGRLGGIAPGTGGRAEQCV